MHWSFVSYERIFARFCWWTLKDSSCLKYLCTCKYSSLTWSAVSSGSSHSHPLFSSWEFFSDPSSQDRSQTGDKNAISQIGRIPRLFCDFSEKCIYIDWSQGRCGLISIYMVWLILIHVFLSFVLKKKTWQKVNYTCTVFYGGNLIFFSNNYF